MEKYKFQAGPWFSKKTNSSFEKPLLSNQEIANSRYQLASVAKKFIAPENNNSKFNPQNFLIPGWKGEGLASKSSARLHLLLREVLEDVTSQLRSADSFNRSLKIAIHQEFLILCEDQAWHLEGAEQCEDFWRRLKQIDLDDSENYLVKFISFFSFRVAVIYLLKIRFLSFLSHTGQTQLEKKDALNPNFYLAQIFRKGGQHEIYSEALQPNVFSWYRPTKHFINCPTELHHDFLNISINEFMKMTSYENASMTDVEHGEGKHFSHSLSQKYYGSYLNQLLIDFPTWLGRRSRNQSHLESLEQVKTCKFIGDHLQALSLSQLIDQKERNFNKQDTIVFPDFISRDHSSSLYLKVFSELNFLISLTEIAAHRKVSPITFLVAVLNAKMKVKREEFNNDQPSLFPDEVVTLNSQTYDRVVVNLLTTPKNNPYFFLINQIQKETESLNENGFLYVITNKKLFIPSQSDKIKNLLDHLRLEGVFCLEEVKGKGEVAPYCYVFSKNEVMKNSFEVQNKKQPCFHFRFRGELSSFHNFAIISDELKKFFTTKSADHTPLYQSEVEGKIVFEFNQDALVDGKLLNSSNPDNGQVTHPNYYKNLMNNCIPLEYFFSLEQLHPENDLITKKKEFNTYDFLGKNSKPEENFTFVLILDLRQNHTAKIELTLSEAYRAKAQNYGFALCHYFGVNSKLPNLNINLFREYFESDIGKQIIQFSFNGTSSKIKTKLNSILVPKFLILPREMPEQHLNQFQLFNYDTNQIRQMNTTVLLDGFKQIENHLDSFFTSYPWKTLGLLGQFKHNLAKVIEGQYSLEHINFQNPLIVESLTREIAYPIYPHNNEFYFEFHCENQEDIHHILTKTVFTMKMVEDKPQYCLDVFSGNSLILKIYSDSMALKFLKFLLDSTEKVPISAIMTHLKLPKVEVIRSVITEYQNLATVLDNLKSRVNKSVNKLFLKQISSSFSA